MILQYIENVLVALNQMVNAMLFGDPDMTLSARMGRAIRNGRCSLCKPVCWLLGKLDKDHCARADRYESDEGKHQIWSA